MSIIDLNNKEFKLLKNSESGQVTSDTIFKFIQKENKFNGTYYDENIVYGSIIGLIENNQKIFLVYHCILNDGQIRVGEANVTSSIINDKIKLEMNWKWITGGNEHGISEYLEI